MRKIKFRAWDTVMRKMVPAFIGEYAPVEDYEIMEFIGQSDQHGTEIYEGDIVTGHFPYSKGTTWIVEYLDGAFQFLNIHSSSEGRFWVERQGPFTVIGNIYANPDPLEAK